LHSVAKIDVLVGVDGSPESFAAVVGVGELFGSRLGRLSVATVIPRDAVSAACADATGLLRRAAFLVADRAERIVLRGSPATALGEYAAGNGYDVIAVGTTGRGFAKALLGSVATELARRTKTPVLLFGSDR
jgi:nucleotide-binding universal stress UspA family protein